MGQRHVLEEVLEGVLGGALEDVLEDVPVHAPIGEGMSHRTTTVSVCGHEREEGGRERMKGVDIPRGRIVGVAEDVEGEVVVVVVVGCEGGGA